MRTLEEWEHGTAAFIRSLRLQSRLSRSKMAVQIGVDPHTLKAWEDGKSAPSVPQMIYMFDQMQEHILPLALEFLYPETYSGVDPTAPIAEVRQETAHFIQNVAPELFVRQWDFLIRGKHDVDFGALLQLCIMFVLLPTESRFVIDQLVASLWDLNAQRGAVKQFPGIQPDVGLFRNALASLGRAVYAGQHTYTTATVRPIQTPPTAPIPAQFQPSDEEK